jgi:hypothetical protein
MAGTQMVSLNYAMKIYDQLEVVPINQMSLMSMNLLFGLVLLNESAYYSWGELIGLLATSLIGLAGIFILGMKKSDKGLDL